MHALHGLQRVPKLVFSVTAEIILKVAEHGYIKKEHKLGPGAATVTVPVRDCSNQTFLSQRSFRVNASPVKAQPPGHLIVYL